MQFLMDTHLLLWSNYDPDILSSKAKDELHHHSESLCFSTVNLIEIAIKQRTGKLEIDVDLHQLRKSLLRSGVRELTVTSDHAIVLATLPLVHRDPFDRLLIAQTIVQGVTLLTADRMLTRYKANVRYIG